MRSSPPPLCRSVDSDAGGWVTSRKGTVAPAAATRKCEGKEERVIGISMTDHKGPLGTVGSWWRTVFDIPSTKL